MLMLCLLLCSLLCCLLCVRNMSVVIVVFDMSFVLFVYICPYVYLSVVLL